MEKTIEIDFKIGNKFFAKFVAVELLTRGKIFRKTSNIQKIDRNKVVLGTKFYSKAGGQNEKRQKSVIISQ